MINDHDNLLEQCVDIVGRAFANGRALAKHENMLDHHVLNSDISQEVEECCGVAVGSKHEFKPVTNDIRTRNTR